MKFGTAWQDANFEPIDKTTEVAPGVTLIALVSDAPGTRELRELSLAVNTPDGVVLLVGCSHPGIDKIVEAATAINPKIHLIAGGFHLVVSPDDVIAKAVAALKDTFKVENVAPEGNGLEQFKKPGTQVIVYPEELASGKLQFTYSEGR